MNNSETTDPVTVLNDVLRFWADGIRAHQPELVASRFTEDAVFQGFDKTHTVGRTGVAAYYDKQPLGLSPAFRILEHRRLGADVVLGYGDVDFTRPDGTIIPVHLTVVVQRVGGAWLISHYHVSKID
jgi:uncharacterized protein (TIGR02246 family)